MEWRDIASAPFDRDLELAVINYDGVHALAFACRRILGGWMKAEPKQRIEIRPTHWREWTNTTLGVLFVGRIIQQLGQLDLFIG